MTSSDPSKIDFTSNKYAVKRLSEYVTSAFDDDGDAFKLSNRSINTYHKNTKPTNPPISIFLFH